MSHIRSYYFRIAYLIITKCKFLLPKPVIVSIHDVPDIQVLEIVLNDLIKKFNFKFVSLEEILENREMGTIALTFDDGYQEWGESVYSLLTSLKIPATFFIASDILESNNPYQFIKSNFKRQKKLSPLSLKLAKKIAANKLFSIGSHSCSHIDFGGTYDSLLLQNEISCSKEKLELLLNTDVKYFAYPFGGKKNYNDHIFEYLNKCNYAAAFTIEPGFVKRSCNIYKIPRHSIDPDEDISVWLAKLYGFSNIRKYFW